MNRASEHLPFLDGLRGVAILSVLLFHGLGVAFGLDQLPWAGLGRNFATSRSFLLLYPCTYGTAGVALFFVVSGFCIHLSHRRSRDQSWSRFFHRRFFRIYPPYLLATGALFFMWPWGSIHLGGGNRIAQLGSHVLALQNLDERTIFGINPSLWSIAVELQLYALYPVLMLLTARVGWRKAMMIVGGIELSLRAVSSVFGVLWNAAPPSFLATSPFAFWLSWALGAYLCECFLTGRTSRLFLVRVDVVAVVSLLLPLFRPTDPFTFLSFSWLSALVIHRFMTGRWSVTGGAPRIVRAGWSHLGFVGVVSYSFYLVHQPILRLTNGALARVLPGTFVHPLVKYAICLAWYPVILLVALGVWRCVEQPSIALGKRMWEKTKPAPPPPPPTATAEV